MGNYSPLTYLVAGYNTVEASQELSLGISSRNYSLLRCLWWEITLRGQEFPSPNYMVQTKLHHPALTLLMLNCFMYIVNCRFNKI